MHVVDNAVLRKDRPISKVVVLLKDMQTQLNEDKKTDEEIYNKMACWCTTNDREKTDEIRLAEARIAELTSTIEEKSALIDKLDEDIKTYREEVEASEQSLASATDLRTTEHEAFQKEEEELLVAIQAVKSAIVVLSEQNVGGAGLLQKQDQKQALINVTSMMREQLRHHASMFQGAFSLKQKRTAALLSQGQVPDYQSYAPRSSEIFGILQQMQETFEANLEQARAEEATAAEAFAGLEEAKLAEIKAGEEAITSAQASRADAVGARAVAEQDKANTAASLSADAQYLRDLKSKCAMTDEEWEQRQKTRTAEIAAIAEAISILDADEAHDVFGKTFNPSFLQEGSKDSSRRHAASRVLAAAANRTGSLALAAIATQANLDSFTKVIEAIDKMVAELLKEKDDEIKQKDWCVGEFNTNDAQTQEKEHMQSNLAQREENLEATLKSVGERIESLKKDNEEMQEEIKKAGDVREAENQEFQTTVADQAETQKIITAALAALKDYYAKKKTALAQQSAEPVGPPAPEGFEKYEDHASASTAIGMLQSILDDAAALEGEARAAEEDAQYTYETFTKDTNAAIEANLRSIVDSTAAKANAEGMLAETKQGTSSVTKELEYLASYKSQLHTSCDFVMDNFEIRQTARDEEVEALRQAKAILSGAS